MTERDQRIADNLGLVHACCRRFQGRGIEYDDLYQAGCVGLVKAIDRYQPELGWALSTYAVPVILGEIRRLFREGGSVKVSRTLRELGLRALRQQEELSKEFEALYQQAAAAQQAAGAQGAPEAGAPGPQNDDGVVDADFKEV